jgi:hypothetical protein
MKLNTLLQASIAIAASAAALPTFATETPVGTPNGADGFFAGALPPAGTYNLLFGNYYRANRYNDGNGNSVVPGFSETAKVIADKILHMTDMHIAGGQVGFYGALALEDVEFAGGTAIEGLSDPEGGVIVGWHSGDLHYYGLATVVVPFNGGKLSNHYTTFRPQMGISYLPASGLDVSARLTYSFNTTNKEDDYKSGQYFHTDFNVGYPIGAGFKAGLQGYYLHQTTNDTKNGVKVGPDGDRGNVLALGPGVIYAPAGGPSIELRYLTEMNVKNRPQGTSTWVKAVWAF